MKTELLKILRESDGYVSGQQLCERFHVSRTAVWKVIQQLKEEGYEVEAVKNRGYRIMTTPDVITAEEISSRLHTNWMAENCIYLESVDSTNNYAKRIAEDGTPSGTLVVADEQTGGKGRRGTEKNRQAFFDPPQFHKTILRGGSGTQAISGK